MSDSQNMSDEVRARLRAIPSVNELLAEWPVVKAAGETCDAVVHAAVTAELDEERAAIRAGAAPRSKRELASAIEWRAHRSALPSLRPAVNATGVVIHTNLGRAPLAESAAKAVAEVARGYSTLEYSVDTCSRGSRKEHAAQLIRSLTGAEDALVVNNNAAAVLLVLATHAAGKEVIVSRGELVEIGGSFRVPEIMSACGATLREVGTTNKTRAADYAAAIGALGGDPVYLLEVMNHVPRETVEAAAALVKADKVKVNVAQVPQKLYIEVIAKGGGHTGRAIVRALGFEHFQRIGAQGGVSAALRDSIRKGCCGLLWRGFGLRV